jgi:6-phosphogluconolactonase (cycloisomerase 2 family)
MLRSFIPRVVLLVVSSLCVALTAFASNPIVTVKSPANNSQTTSPVNFVASALSPDCPQGILAMRIYSAPYVSAFTGAGDKINTYITLRPGTYNAVVQAWDNCGNVGKTDVTITAAGETKPAGFVYTINSDYDYERTTSNVRGFAIVGSNGALAPTLQGPVSANVDPVAVVSDKGGYRLYVADYVSGDVFAYFIDRRSGYVNSVPGTPFAAHRSVAAVAVHPSGALVFAALSEYAQGDGVAVFQVQSDGSLKQAAGSPYSTQAGPQALKVDPSGNYLYVADGSGYIEAFAIDTVSAALTPLPGSPYQLPVETCRSSYPRDLVDSFGKTLYAADAVNSAIDGYTIESTTGTLTQVPGSPWPDDGDCQGVAIDDPLFDYNPRSLAMDGTGKFLYALNELDFNIAIYSVSANGALTFLKFTPQNSACQGAVRTDPTGNYLYAGACPVLLPASFGGLVGFSIDHTTGDLTPLATSPYTYPQPGRTAVQDIAVTP